MKGLAALNRRMPVQLCGLHLHDGPAFSGVKGFYAERDVSTQHRCMRYLQLLLGCLLLAWAHASPVPVALDSGTSWTRLAHFNPASAEGIDFVVSDQGDRRFPTVVGFSGEDTVYGDEADSLSQRRAERTVPHLPRLLGFAYGGESFASYKKDFPQVPLTDLPRGDIAVNAGWDHSPSIAELYARFLRFFVFPQASTQLSFTGLVAGDPLPIVIAYPLGSALPYQQMLEQVVHAAGGAVRNSISSAAAAGTDWAVRMLRAGEEAEVVIVDVGTLGSTAAVVSAAKSAEGQITVKVMRWARDVEFGGFRVDQAIAAFLKKKAEVRYAFYVCAALTLALQNGRTITWTAKRESRVLRAARELKEALSAGTQAEVLVEELLPEWDFKVVVSREEVDEACKELYDRFATYNPLRQLKVDNHISKNVKLVEYAHAVFFLPIFFFFFFFSILKSQWAVVSGRALHLTFSFVDRVEHRLTHSIKG